MANPAPADADRHRIPFRRYRRINVRFRLPYFTQWGQNLIVLGSDATLGAWDPKRGLAMVPHHQGESLIWQSVLSVRDNFETQYNYCVVDEKRNVLRRECGAHRTLVLPEDLLDGASVDVFDLWQDGSSPESLLSRSAFRKAILRRCEDDDHDLREPIVNATHDWFPSGDSNLQDADSLLVRFKISCPRLRSGQFVHLIGGASELGKWELGKALRLLALGGSCWQGDCIIQRNEFPLRYKYVVKDKAGKVIPEVGTDREICIDNIARKPSSMIIISDGYFKENPWRGAGLAVPVFSIRSKDDVGVGEFSDLKMLVDLAVKSGLHIIQLLPVNDTSVHRMWWDSYPYSSLSVFALHPLYLRVQELSHNLPDNIKEEIENARKQLDLKQVDYEATMATKMSIAKKIFYLEKDEVLSSIAFQSYFVENQDWLKPYAAFCFLRDLFGTSDHTQWGLFSEFSIEKLERLVAPSSEHYGAVSFNYYIQFHLHLQLSEAAEYAKKNRVSLKGDLPIGVDRHSVDTWVYPTLFRMNTSTGAPPDYFDKNGQNWGFPTYNWEAMSKDNYSWWKKRLTQMAKYFTAYRIDHILGFFRIWELPDHAVTGLLGKFRPSIPLSQEELEKEGIWDFNRLSQPYVRCHLLQEKFGTRWAEVASTYFNECQHLCYEFKEEYNTEKKICARTRSETLHIEDAQETEKRLFELLHEVVLIKDPENPTKFYPRFGLEQTASFNDLDDHSKDVLQRLYYDYYFHRQEVLWRENALKTLPVLLNSSDMLACGEDLGLIPACVQPVMHELGLIGLRIQRMPNTPGREFGIPANYEYTTVCAPSCHDCSTLRAWWEEDESRRIKYFKDILGFCEAPPAKCDPRIALAVIQQHLEAPSMWAIFPLQDFLALKEEYARRPAKEETINDPTNPKHYWRFRLHVSLEDLLADQEFTSTVRELIENSGRSIPPLSSILSVLKMQNGDIHQPSKALSTTRAAIAEDFNIGMQANGHIENEKFVINTRKVILNKEVALL